MTIPVTGERGRLWEPNFTLLFLSRFAKVMADNITAIAVVWLLIEMGGSAMSTALLYACNLVPQTVLSSLVSPLLSRGRLTHWMFASEVVRGALVAVMPVLAMTGQAVPFWLLFTLVFLQSATGAFYSPASVALLPKIVRPAQIQKANALMQSSSEVVTLLGLAGAGLLITLLSAETTLLLAAGMFLLSALLVTVVRTNPEVKKPGDAEEADQEAGLSYWQRIRSGFTILRQHKLLYAVAVTALFLNIGVAPWTALAAIFVAQDLSGDADLLTLLRGSTALGAFLMGLVLTKVNIRRQGALFLLAGAVEGVMFAMIGSSPWLWLSMIGCFVFGICLTAINVPEMVIIQTTVPAHQQAQVYSVIMTLSIGLLPFAYLAAGWLADVVGNRPVIIGGGVLILVAALVVRLGTGLAGLTVAAPARNE